jgi:hypothetical protein
VAALCDRAAAVPCERRAVLAGGLRGAAKDEALAGSGIDRGRYFVVSVDLVLAELARRSLIPVVGGLSPLEGAGLVHAETQHIGKRLAARAVAEGRDLLLDVTMGSAPSVESWLVNLGLAAYSVQVVISPVSGNDAFRWADAEHRRGYEAYRRGQGCGGRYVPPEAIVAAARLGGGAGRQRLARDPPAGRQPAGGSVPGRRAADPGPGLPGRPDHAGRPGAAAAGPPAAAGAAGLSARSGGSGTRAG